jgi:hypothetical protein
MMSENPTVNTTLCARGQIGLGRPTQANNEKDTE